MPDSLRPEISQTISDSLAAEVSPTLKFLTIRITDLDGSVTKEKVIKFCQTETVTFLGGQEYANNHHFHLVLTYENIPKTLDLTQRIYTYFDVPLNKNNKPQGNASHSIKIAKNVPESLVYCLKDGDYFSNGFSTELMDFMFSHSFKKQSMTTTFEELCQDYQENKTTILQLSEDLIKLRSTFNCLNFSRIQEVIYSQQIIKKPSLAKDVATTKIKYL